MPPQVFRFRLPSYRRHKPSGQAVVTLSGRDFYLGRYGTQGSRAEYNRLVGDFGPVALKALRQKMIDACWCRGVVDQRTSRIKRIFKWAVAEELVPPSVHHGLCAVDGLRKGRSSARESASVQPLADAVVDATLPHLPEIVADMVRLQRLAGCRPGERYNTNTYCHVIHHAVEVVNRKRIEDTRQNGIDADDVELLPKWSPNRLRHAAATEIRKHFGLEAAQVTLGYATADVSQIYAERDLTLAVEIMRKIG